MEKKKTKKLKYKFYFLNNRKENNFGIIFWYRTEFYKYFKKNKDCLYSESKFDYSDRDIESKISNRMYIFNPSTLGNKHKLASMFSSNSKKSYFPLKYIINLDKILMPDFEKNGI